MSARERLDVVMPTDRCHPFLKPAVHSVLGQAGVDIRLFLVDDGSVDDAGTQVEDWGLTEVTVIRHHENRGAAAARNTGIAAGASPWVGFLDSDDLWPLDRCERMLAHQDDDDRLLVGHERVFDSEDPPAPADYFPVSGSRPTLLAGAMLFPREVLERVGPFDESLRLGEFVDWMRRARDLGVAEQAVPSVSLLRRSHADNITRTRSDAFGDYLTVIARARRERGLSPASEGQRRAHRG